jgi:hypothetical protein
MLNITPIRLLKGHHDDTARTGSGCFMDVAAYLNGDEVITDESPCVCSLIRPVIIAMNDTMSDEDRQTLLPFMVRAMGSATEDGFILGQRLIALLKLGDALTLIDPSPATENVLKARNKACAAAAGYGGNINEVADHIAAAMNAVLSWSSRNQNQNQNSTHAAGMAFLDEALPVAQAPSEVVLQRAKTLIKTHELHTMS